MSKLILSFLVCALMTSCSKSSCDDVKKDKRTLDYFSKNLDPVMQYNDIVTTFGNPDGDRGSGIHIYVYKLSNASEIWIGFTDHIHYARHLDSTGILLHTLI